MGTMLRYALVLLAGFWAAEYAGAATWADGLFSELNKDFGSVPRGQLQEHHFRLTNNTKSTVNVSSVRVSCGCVTATIDKPTIAPGESASVQARMDTGRFVGVRSVTIFVQFDRPHFEEVRLWVSANARLDFNVAPDSLAMGTLKRGGTPSSTVSLTFYGNKEAQVLSVKGESNYVIPEFRELRRLDSEVVYQLTAKLRSDTPVGKWYTDVWVKTNLPTMPQVRVPLTVEVESALTVSPELVAVGRVKLKEESERRVIVRGAKPFKVLKLQGIDDEVRVVDNTTEAREVHVLTVRFKPERAGNVTRTVKVVTDLTADKEVDFQVNALVVDE
jgi:hypothetical protein